MPEANIILSKSWETRELSSFDKGKWAVFYLTVLLIAGTVGYHLIEPSVDLFSAFYMTVITISTVGFSEISGLSLASRPLTLLLIFMGIGLISFVFFTLSQAVVEGELRRMLGRRKLDKKLKALKNHIVICGFGRVGAVVAQVLQQHGKEFVVIESSAERREELEKSGFAYIIGDATDDAVLEQAGIRRASSLISATYPDAQNVFIILTARELNPELVIHSRAYADEALKRLERAGADRVIYPDKLGGYRLAMGLLRPSFVNFIDILSRSYEEGDITLDELTIGEGCNLIGRALRDIDMRKRFNLIIITIGKRDGDMHFNPGGDTVIEDGDTLVVVGPKHDLTAFARQINARELEAQQ